MRGTTINVKRDAISTLIQHSSLTQQHYDPHYINMRVFITGVSGFIGTAVTKDLITHGHEVIGLARNDASADKITKLGGTPHKGDLFDLESLKAGAASTDAVIHPAFVHGFSSPDIVTKNCATDRAAISAMGEAIAGTGKALIIASGTLGLAEPDGKPATEDTPGARGSGFSERTLSADLVQTLSKDQNIRGMVIRLAPIVHEVVAVASCISSRQSSAKLALRDTLAMATMCGRRFIIRILRSCSGLRWKRGRWGLYIMARLRRL